MAYHVYLGKMLCPIAPSSIETKINGNNKTLTLINEGEINILKKAGLTDISFDLLLPNVSYSFATYKSGFKNAKYFLDQLEDMKTSKTPFQFVVSRQMPNGRVLFDTNMKVSLEDYTIKEDSKEGYDLVVSVELKQYKNYGTKTCTVVVTEEKTTLTEESRRPAETAPKAKTHSVVSGDCLWNIAKKYLGDGSRYTEIYALNKDKISNPNLIYPGQTLTLPEK